MRIRNHSSHLLFVARLPVLSLPKGGIMNSKRMRSALTSAKTASSLTPHCDARKQRAAIFSQRRVLSLRAAKSFRKERSDTFHICVVEQFVSAAVVRIGNNP